MYERVELIGVQFIFQAAEQPQPDLGSTINALSETPPNVTLIPDYHHNLYQPSKYRHRYILELPTSTSNKLILLFINSQNSLKKLYRGPS